MRIRRYEPEDRIQIVELFKKQTFDYELPTSKELIENLVLVDDDNKIKLCLAAKPSAELFMITDPEWDETPGIKFEAFSKLHNLMIKSMSLRGIKQGHVWIPPEVSRNFGRRLRKKFGWLRIRPDWLCLTKRVA